MVTVNYQHQFPYLYTDNALFPLLQLQIQAQSRQTEPLDVDAHLDSGAKFSLFDGEIPQQIGLDILSGQRREYFPVSGPPIDARVLPVHLMHDTLGHFELEIGFSLGAISRNLLGRDFFDLIQVGFREHQLTLYISATP